jgi:hypothetical protein
LRGLAADLTPTVPALANLTNATIPLMRDQVRPAASCVVNIIIPWSQLTLKDPNFNASNGFPEHKVFVEAVDFLPGLAGESRNFDANGPYIRIIGNGGTFTYSLSPGLFGQSLTKIDSVQPKIPPGGQRPPYQPNVPCETQAPITDLSAPAGGPIPSTSLGGLPTPAARARWVGVSSDALKALQVQANNAGLQLNTAHSGAGTTTSSSATTSTTSSSTTTPTTTSSASATPTTTTSPSATPLAATPPTASQTPTVAK